MKNRHISNAEILFRGQFLAGLPALLIMFLTIILLDEFTSMDYRIRVLVSIVPGWIYWRYAIESWIKWCLNNNIERERLHKIGKYGLLIWQRSHIDEIADNKQKPWF